MNRSSLKSHKDRLLKDDTDIWQTSIDRTVPIYVNSIVILFQVMVVRTEDHLYHIADILPINLLTKDLPLSIEDLLPAALSNLDVRSLKNNFHHMMIEQKENKKNSIKSSSQKTLN